MTNQTTRSGWCVVLMMIVPGAQTGRAGSCSSYNGSSMLSSPTGSYAILSVETWQTNDAAAAREAPWRAGRRRSRGSLLAARRLPRYHYLTLSATTGTLLYGGNAYHRAGAPPAAAATLAFAAATATLPLFARSSYAMAAFVAALAMTRLLNNSAYARAHFHARLLPILSVLSCPPLTAGDRLSHS